MNQQQHELFLNTKGKPVQSDQKNVVYNIYIENLHKGFSKSKSINMAATTSGISERKIWGIVKEKEISGSLKSPSKKRNRKGIINKLNEEQKKLVRRCVHRFFLRNEPPTLDKFYHVRIMPL
jgi:molybdenum-dependent DNA-binding transcriptional regulator ModE